jgi:glycosyltransferase involved in cell wall biosynthesis
MRVSVWRQAAELAAHVGVTVLSPRRIYPPLRRYAETGTPLVPPSARVARAAPPPFRLQHPAVVHVPFLWPLLEPLQLIASALWSCLLRGPRPRLVHAHRALPMGFTAVLLARLLRCPSVITVHGTEVNVEAVSGSWIVRLLSRFALTRATRVIAVSRALAERLVALGVPAERIRTVSNGVDVVLFAPGDRMAARRALELPLDRFVFLAPSMFDPVKGHTILIRALAKLDRRRPVFLAMTGDGTERPDVERLIAEFDLGDRVRFAGLLAQGEMPPWVNAADALVLPSLNEGMPLTVLEGFACGKPLVGSRVGGVGELVADERFGLLVPPGDVEALAGALAAAADREWDRAVICARAQEFAWPRIIEQILAVYGELRPRSRET